MSLAHHGIAGIFPAARSDCSRDGQATTPGEQVLIWRVYAVCAALSGMTGITLSVRGAGASAFDRIVLASLGALCVFNVVRAARFKKPSE